MGTKQTMSGTIYSIDIQVPRTYETKGALFKEQITLLSEQTNIRQNKQISVIELDYPWNWKRITESKSFEIHAGNDQRRTPLGCFQFIVSFLKKHREEFI